AGIIAGANAKNFNTLVIASGATATHSTGGNIKIAGNFTNNGTFTQGSALTTTFDTTGSHSLGGAGTTTFGGVTIQGSPAIVNAGSHQLPASWDLSVTLRGR